MRFLVDAQLPPALARVLAAHGHHAEHVIDVGLGDAPDRTIWRYAVVNRAVIVTKDEDFPRLLVVDADGPVIVWLRVGNTRKSALVAWFEPRITDIVEAVESGSRVVEFR
ncbi:DUF5615 family PIN-like protein [Leucobacter massiliensis]|uniref:DUF5615 domain-containing protein n=1 Tax=Leucobacter massiliensis TaxID=1686285 RepID=A0A2S9QQK2_9MICO|nr:DUF5615 family PIN-like protein [Leucobacter massiliensis]PRI11852.1 hypothetical protein B4915_05330 [Leucobacter massiliensis]